MSTGPLNADDPSTWESFRALNQANWNSPLLEEWELVYECWECEGEYMATIVHPKPERRFCPDCSPTRGHVENVLLKKEFPPAAE